MPNIILTSDVRTFLQLAVNVKSDEFDKYIKRSQALDLKPILGEKFYFDFINNFETNVDYQKLFEGGSYAPDSDGFEVEFNGVKEILSYYTYVRFLKGNNEQTTRTGYVEKNTQQSTLTNNPSVFKKSANLLSDANQMKSTLIKYVECNLDLFPLYQTKNTTDNTSKGIVFGSFRKDIYT